MRTNSPIYTTKQILEETGFVMEIQTEASEEKTETDVIVENVEPRLENYAIEELERTLNKLIEQENYEEAARVNEILQRKRREQDNSGI